VKVLVTGATGFIGRNVLAPLISSGYEVHAVYAASSVEKLSGVYWHQVNLLDKKAVSNLLVKVQPTHLLHFAWYADPGKFWNSIENYRWLESSISLLLEFHRNGGQRVVMAGTCAEYDWNYGICSEYTTPRKPSTPYGVCKNALQEILNSYAGQFKLSSAWGRVFFLYGPGENPAKLVSSVINSLLKGEVANCSTGSQKRDFMHVSDVASAFVALLNSDVDGVVNVGSGQSTSVREIVVKIANMLKAEDRINFGAIPTADNESQNIEADVSRLNNLVGWKPTYDLSSGLMNTVQYWQKILKL